MNYAPFFKVVVIKIDMIESTIIDERHFGTKAEARSYSNTMQDAGYITILTDM